MPWLGYLDRIARSDIFVFLDNVQFEKNSYINRNKIKTANGPIWLTVPVLMQGHIRKKMTELEINNQKNWRTKHLKAIECNYRKSKNFEICWQKLETLYGQEDACLVDLCFDHLKFWLSEFNILTKIVRASEIDISGVKDQLVFNICKHYQATTYLSGPFGREYLDFDQFSKANIELIFHDYSHPIYSQLYGEFLPNMGVVDYWMNDGRSEIFKRQRR